MPGNLNREAKPKFFYIKALYGRNPLKKKTLNLYVPNTALSSNGKTLDVQACSPAIVLLFKPNTSHKRFTSVVAAIKVALILYHRHREYRQSCSGD
jgi:hypothetical protein